MNQDLLYKYFKGNANIEEEKQILDWVDASDENRKAFQKERMLYDIALFSEEKQSERLKRKTRILLLWRQLHPRNDGPGGGGQVLRWR